MFKATQSSVKNEEPLVRELAERMVAFVSFTGNYIGNAQVFGDLFHKLGDWAGIVEICMSVNEA